MKGNKKMKVLIACEYSGTVREEFKKLGHEAWSCDILPTEIPGNHFQGDVLEYLEKDWDLIIAHPPCTYLSNAGACRLYPEKGKLNMERYQKGLVAKDFFMKFYNHSCKKIAIENPVSSRIFELPEYSQEIQPYQFGHPYTKKTRLWLKGLPKLKPTNIIDKSEVKTFIESGTSRYKNTDRNKNRYVARGSKDRSKFWVGIAQAMAQQWGENE
jgi:hypothetical protein